jgi:PAS domain S-box-containing protein
MSDPLHRGTRDSAEACLTAIMDSIDDAIIATTPDGTITSWNAAAERLFGYTTDEMARKSISLIFPQNLATEVPGGMERARRGEPGSAFETVLIDKGGQVVDVLLKFSPINDDTGSVVGLLTIARDVTRRKKGVRARLQRDRELLTLHRLSEIVLSPRSFEESCRDIVQEICAATGFPVAAIALYDEPRQMVVFHGLQNQATQRGSPVQESPIDETMSGVVIRSGKPLIERHVLSHREYRSRVMRWAHADTFVGYPMKVGPTIIGCLNLAHTESIEISPETAQWIESLANYVAVLTERKRAEEDLRASREQLRELSRWTQSAIEGERTRIAREIHDELGQELSLLQLDLGLILDRLPKVAKDLRTQAKAMTKLIDSAIRSVQKISTELRPTLLDNLGLGAAVDWVASDFQKRTKIRCRVSVDPPDLKLDQERSTAFFRILQEALTNVLRHAKATRVDVHLEKRDESVVLTVRDNGTGISPHRITDPKSVGLTGMRERVYPWRGNVAISGTPGEGTEVIVTIPLSP